ncbi:hypothetical protein B0H13DRAFT_1880658 [Mycena leptocephala]|nr:hypothetical protein B0H13DRAFT_1880658 [Mycena leptocephala]
MPLRMAQLVDEFHSQMNLGHLVFGEHAWLSLGGRRCVGDDPITALYRTRSFIPIVDLLSSSTMLKPNFYMPLFLPSTDFRGKKSSHRPTFTFHNPKEMCSITRNFPLNSHWSSDPSIQTKQSMQPKAVRPISGTNRESMFIKKIITDSGGVSIGPLEYCGFGHIVYIGPTAHVAVCKGDPAIPEYHEKRFLTGLDRVSSHLDTSGKLKRARSEQETKKLLKKLLTIEKGYHRAGTHLAVTDDCETQPSKPKKQRLSADQRLIN